MSIHETGSSVVQRMFSLTGTECVQISTETWSLSPREGHRRRLLESKELWRICEHRTQDATVNGESYRKENFIIHKRTLCPLNY